MNKLLTKDEYITVFDYIQNGVKQNKQITQYADFKFKFKNFLITFFIIYLPIINYFTNYSLFDNWTDKWLYGLTIFSLFFCSIVFSFKIFLLNTKKEKFQMTVLESAASNWLTSKNYFWTIITAINVITINHWFYFNEEIILMIIYNSCYLIGLILQYRFISIWVFFNDYIDYIEKNDRKDHLFKEK